ncbi:MAG: YfhO family protein, partial [Lachnospiraceae bacterium]|nr:YfhO family protein [Lachnospiraceae bacterium]
MTSKSPKPNGKAREAGKACLVFSVLFALMTAALLWYFHHSGRTFVWMNDAYRQHIRAMIYYSRWFRSLFGNFLKGDFTIPSFSFSLGYGGDILTTFHHYGLDEPLCFLSVLVPEDGMVWFYTALIFIRMYLAGLAFIAFYLYRRGRRPFGEAASEQEPASPFLTASGALTYVFAAYPVLFCMQHPHFLAAFIYFPLLLLGIERASAERKPALMILTVFLTAISSFYFLYMIAILGVLWYLIRRLPLRKDFRFQEFVKESLRLLLYGIAGVLMAGVVFLPAVAAFLQDARSAEHSAVALFYLPDYYRNILQSTVSSDAINRYWYSALGFGGVFVACFSMLLLRLRKNIRLFLMIFLMTLGLMVPFFGYVMNGFGYVVNRWLFAFCLAAGVVVASMLEEFGKATLKEVLIALLISVIYAVLAILVRSSATTSYLRQLVFLGAFFVLALLAVILVPKLPEKIRKRSIVSGAFALTSAGIIMASLLYNDYRYLKTTVKRPMTVFVSPDGSRKGTLFWDNDALMVSETGDSGLFRYVTDDPGQRYENTSLLYDLSATQYYWSISNPNISRFMTELCVSDPVNLHEWYHGMDDRSELLLLSGVRYYLRKGEGLIPYSYEEEKTEDNTFTGLSLYRTDQALPFAWTYDRTISEEALLSLPPVLRQEALMKAVAVSGEPAEERLPEELGKAENVRALALSFSAEKDLRHSGQGADVLKKKASLTLRLEASEACESYLYVTGLSFTGR